jgi:hypothetical protein
MYIIQKFVFKFQSLDDVFNKIFAFNFPIMMKQKVHHHYHDGFKQKRIAMVG